MPREMALTSWLRFSKRRAPHQLQVIHNHQAELLIAALQTPQLGVHVHQVQRRPCHQ